MATNNYVFSFILYATTIGYTFGAEYMETKRKLLLFMIKGILDKA